jgi:tetratricopeptide (TPR) repeat protein
VTPVSQDAGPRTLDLRAEGDAAMAGKRYDEAALKYQTALNQAPEDIALRYALATALSYLDRRDEAIENFRIVMQRGAPGSFEVKAARQWLANAGALGEGESAEATAAATPESIAEAEAAEASTKGKVGGKIEWKGITPQTRMVRINVRLTGEDAANRDVTLGREFKIGRVYEIRNVPPGDYRLVAEVGSTAMWDMKVTVPAAKATALDLTESNASVAKDFDPGN